MMISTAACNVEDNCDRKHGSCGRCWGSCMYSRDVNAKMSVDMGINIRY